MVRRYNYNRKDRKRDTRQRQGKDEASTRADAVPPARRIEREQWQAEKQHQVGVERKPDADRCAIDHGLSAQ